MPSGYLAFVSDLKSKLEYKRKEPREDGTSYGAIRGDSICRIYEVPLSVNTVPADKSALNGSFLLSKKDREKGVKTMVE